MTCTFTPVFTGRSMVLLSGGLDSVAALLWAHRRDPKTEAIFVHYGQPASAREWSSAVNAAAALSVPVHTVDVGTVYSGSDAGLFRPSPSAVVGGLDTAFVPCRNHLLLSIAAAKALTRWPGLATRLVVGFNQNDAMGFPDCTERFTRAVRGGLDAAVGWDGAFFVDAPWIRMSKAQIVQWIRENDPEHVQLLAESWSCYRADGPCGECTACRVRSSAL